MDLLHGARTVKLTASLAFTGYCSMEESGLCKVKVSESTSFKNKPNRI